MPCRTLKQSSIRDLHPPCDQRHDVIGDTTVDERVCLMERQLRLGERGACDATEFV
jgi:hypothetical protein